MGCATTEIKPTAITTNTVLTPEQGIVIIQVINNAEKLAPLHQDWNEVCLCQTKKLASGIFIAISPKTRCFTIQFSLYLNKMERHVKILPANLFHNY